MASYDPGPNAALTAHFAALPSYGAHRSDFWYDWGPIFYRGRCPELAVGPNSFWKSSFSGPLPATIVRPQRIRPVGASVHVASEPYNKYASHSTSPSDHAEPAASCGRIEAVCGPYQRPTTFCSSQR